VAGVSGGSVVATDRLQAPAIAGFAAYPTADCVRPIGVGGSGPGAGGLISFGLTDHHCRALARAAMLDRLGHREAAIEALCEIDEARAALRRAGTPCAADRPAAAPRSFDEVASSALLPPSGRAQTIEVFANAPACAIAPPGESPTDRLTRERNCR
jgi:hypothetical protein